MARRIPSDVNEHQQITDLWRDFRVANPQASREQIEAFARTIDSQFKEHWW